MSTYLMHNIGCLSTGSTTVFGWEGWRFVFLSVAAVSVLIGVLNWLQAHDPNYTQDGSSKLSGAAVLSLRDIWRELKVVMSIPTFLLIIVQVISVRLPCGGKTLMLPQSAVIQCHGLSGPYLQLVLESCQLHVW